MNDHDMLSKDTVRRMIEQHKRRWEDMYDKAVEDTPMIYACGGAIRAIDALLIDLNLQYEHKTEV